MHISKVTMIVAWVAFLPTNWRLHMVAPNHLLQGEGPDGSGHNSNVIRNMVLT